MNGYQNWILLTLLLAALPGFVHLPPWVAGVAAAGVALRYIGARRRKAYGKYIAAALLAVTAVAIWFSFESWFGGDAVLSFFICVVFLKWSEARGDRDCLLLIFAAVILAAVGALYYENLPALLHILAVVFALSLSLLAIHTAGSGLKPLFLLRRAGRLFLLGVPLTVFLFLFFPRIPGPLWDIGLAFGMPVKVLMDRTQGEFGKATSLQPGGLQTANQQNGNVLIAEFKGGPPFKSRLYWRGPVFWDFDGESWKLAEDWDNRGELLKGAIRNPAALARELHHKDDPVRYTLQVMPNGGRWLYGLDAPAAPAPEAFISSEMQLLSIRRIDDQEPKFPMLSYLEYGFGSRLAEEQRGRALALPEGTNPRLAALGRDLAERYREPDEIARQVLTMLSQGGYRYDAAHLVAPSPDGNDMLDRFFFDEKRGGAEYLAGSFAVLMRSAGIPSRLVGGFRGGTIVALTDFVIVKQSDAHVWVEIWQDGKGWRRVEPKDMVLPPEPPKGGETLRKSDAGEIKMELPPPVPPTPATNDDDAGDADKPDNKMRQKPASGAGGSWGWDWKLPDWSALFGNVRKWIIRYDPDRQMDVMKGVGMAGGDWLDMLLLVAAGVVSAFGVYLLILWRRTRRQTSLTVKAWRDFCGVMKKLGVGKQPGECARDYLRRVCRERPEMEAAVEDIVRRYIDIRYGGQDSPEDELLFRRQVQRFTSMT